MIIDITLAPDEEIADVAEKARAFAEALGVPMDFVDVWRTYTEGQYVCDLRRKSPDTAERWLRLTKLANNE